MREELFNFKDGKSQKVFQSLTSKTTEFTKCFEGEASLEEKIEKWRGILISFCLQSFSKIRIKQNKTSQISPRLKSLINKRNKLLKEKISMKSTNTDTLEKEIDGVNCIIADVEAKENRDKIVKQFKYFSDNPHKIEMQKIWKTLKKGLPQIKTFFTQCKDKFKG